MNKSNDFLESLTTSYFSNTTLKLCQDLLYIVYIYTGAPRRSWRQIVYLVDGVDLTSDPRHANPTRSLHLLPDLSLEGPTASLHAEPGYYDAPLFAQRPVATRPELQQVDF